MTDDRSPRKTGHFGPKRPTFAEEFPDVESLKVVISLLSPSETQVKTLGKDDQVPSGTMSCRCKGTFPIGQVVRELIETRRTKHTGWCEGGRSHNCSGCFMVTIDATYKQS